MLTRLEPRWRTLVTEFEVQRAQPVQFGLEPQRETETLEDRTIGNEDKENEKTENLKRTIKYQIKSEQSRSEKEERTREMRI